MSTIANKSQVSNAISQSDSHNDETGAGEAHSFGGFSVFISAIESFRPCFSRERTHYWFIVIMIGFLIRQDHLGVTSIIRWLSLPASCYVPCLHFFHSSAWNLQSILDHWWIWVSQQELIMKVGSRMVLLGDHTQQPKDGRRMPGVLSLHEDSETSSKPSYFRGHKWGFIGVVLQRGKNLFCTPLWGQLHLGRNDVGETINMKDDTPLLYRPLYMAIMIAKKMKMPAYLVLDAYFSAGTIFKYARSVLSKEIQAPLLHIITRAKKSYVGYEEPEPAPEPAEKKPPGRPRTYGRKLKLRELFESMADQFVKAPCQVYGQMETVSFLVLDLLWRPLGDKIRFVLAVTSRGPIILMCSDMELEPVEILKLYCTRQRIETMFSVLKHVFGGLGYHFWSKHLTPQSRRPKKNSKHLRFPLKEDIVTIERTWRAIESFVNFACIVQGLLQVISLQLGGSVWAEKCIWLRTYSRVVASENTIRHLISSYAVNYFNVKRHVIVRRIQGLIESGSRANAPHSQ